MSRTGLKDKNLLFNPRLATSLAKPFCEYHPWLKIEHLAKPQICIKFLVNTTRPDTKSKQFLW